ncbi:MAG: CerR family C-terminal domain-containing protein [Phascolarctobacterium sp.]|nr:CerR family C-terminal domain-containing protein [Phascolarctobacterium sp.]
MLEQENISTSAIKILEAATELFARDNFDAVSIKQIASASGVNSALISYYFGGKKNLYQEVLVTHAKFFISLQDQIRKQDISPLAKLRAYVDTIAKIQAEHPYRIHLIFRELLMPNPTFDGFVKNYLYRAHKFMAELVEAAIAEGEIDTEMQPTHVAFSLESMILFFFLMRSHVKILGNFDEGKEIEYLYRNLDSFLDTLKK